MAIFKTLDIYKSSSCLSEGDINYSLKNIDIINFYMFSMPVLTLMTKLTTSTAIIFDKKKMFTYDANSDNFRREKNFLSFFI